MEPRECRICLNCEDDDRVESKLSERRDVKANKDWLSPCRCDGSIKWVHRDCLQRWIEHYAGEGQQRECISCKFTYRRRRVKSARKWRIEWVEGQSLYDPPLLTTLLCMVGFLVMIEACQSSTNGPGKLLEGMGMKQVMEQLEAIVENEEPQELPGATMVYLSVVSATVCLLVRCIHRAMSAVNWWKMVVDDFGIVNAE